MNNFHQDFITNFAGLAGINDSIESIESYFSMLPKLPKGIYIREIEIFHKFPLSEIIENNFRPRSTMKFIYQTKNFFGIRYLNRNEKQVENGYFAILPGKQKNISRLITIAKSSFWNQVVKRLATKFYPEAMPVYFRQDEIKAALHNFEKGLGVRHRIRIADVTAKEERSSLVSSRIRRYDTQRWWTDLPINEVFDQALERGQWFTGLRYVIQRRVGDSEKFLPQSSGRLHKFGEISFDDFFEATSSFLVDNLNQQASKRLVTLDGRSLQESKDSHVAPIEMSFDFDIFSEVEEIRRFGRVINEYPNSTKAIYHSNPYYHASVSDFIDGSSFELWILSPNKVVMLPQAKSSVQAFERIITHISSNFYEGVVDEYHS